MYLCFGGHPPPNVMRQVLSMKRKHASCLDRLLASSRDPLVSASSTLGFSTCAMLHLVCTTVSPLYLLCTALSDMHCCMWCTPLYLICTGLSKDQLGSSCLCGKHHSDSAIGKTSDRGEPKPGKHHTAWLGRLCTLHPPSTTVYKTQGRPAFILLQRCADDIPALGTLDPTPRPLT